MLTQDQVKHSMITQLVDIYLNHETWHTSKLSEEQVKIVFSHLFDKDKLIFCLDSEGRILGYGEYWKINYEQLGKVICQGSLDVTVEDIDSGNIAWVAGVFIHPEFRNTQVLDALKIEFFKRTFRCEYFIGEARRKKHAPLKVFTRQEFYDKYARSKQGD